LDFIPWKGIVALLMGTRNESRVKSCKYLAVCVVLWKAVAAVLDQCLGLFFFGYLLFVTSPEQGQIILTDQ